LPLDANGRILVVDDSRATRAIVRNKMLAQLGYKNIEDATDGSVALKMLEKQKLSATRRGYGAGRI
jgi:two-component system, chemotaxis family, chemotaxis protein CheY